MSLFVWLLRAWSVFISVWYCLLGILGVDNMNCPKCRGSNLRCVDSRSKTETTRRRHVCLDCNYRFSTVEISVDEWKSVNEKVSFLQKLLDLAKEGWVTNET